MVAREARILVLTRSTTESRRMLIATTLDTTTARSAMPLAPNTLGESGLSLDLLAQLALKQLHVFGELKGIHDGGAAWRQLPGRGAGARVPQGPAPRGSRRWRHNRRRVVPIPHHRRWADAHRPLPAGEPVRGRGAGPIRTVPAVHARLHPVGAAGRDAGAGRRGAHASGSQPEGARSAGCGDQFRPFDVRLRAAGKREDGDRAGCYAPCCPAISPSHTRSNWKGQSSDFSTRSTTSRSTMPWTNRNGSTCRAGTTAGGSAAGGRW